MKKCYCCGADVPDQSKFCPKCGKPMAVTRDLIDRAKANDSDAQAELYERTYKTVYSRIRAKIADADTVMDIMQETYLRAFNSLDQLQKAETFPSWILTIANRQVCDWYKKNGKEQQNVQMSELEYESDDTISDEDDLLEMPEYREDFSPDESLDRAETGRLLSEILDTLPEDQRIILTMRYYDEMSLQEISKDLGVNLSTVKSRLTAGKKKVEAKVLELEKSGTKLYSLGPIAFLVYLLHHAELFAPAISANTVIGLAAAGAAGAGAGGAAAVHVTAGAAAKTAVAAAAKGISVKVVAIVAAAVIVVGGGTTATVVAVNNARATSDTASADTSNTESAGSSQEVIVGLTPEETPTDEEETEPETSEEPEEAEVSEEPSEEDSDQQEPEPSGAEENQEEEAQAAVIDLPSYDAVYNMTEPLSDWIANIGFISGVSLSDTGKIYFNTNEAVEVAGMAASYNEQTRESGLIQGSVSAMSPDLVDTYLRKLFGSQYQLSEFTNSYGDDYGGLYNNTISAFKKEYPDCRTLEWLRRGDDGYFYVEILGTDSVIGVDNVIVKSIDRSNDSTCTATIEYDCFGGDYLYEVTFSFDVYFTMITDGGAEYGWAINSIAFSDDYNVQEYQMEEPDYY